MDLKQMSTQRKSVLNCVFDVFKHFRCFTYLKCHFLPLVKFYTCMNWCLHLPRPGSYRRHSLAVIEWLNKVMNLLLARVVSRLRADLLISMSPFFVLMRLGFDPSWFSAGWKRELFHQAVLLHLEHISFGQAVFTDTLSILAGLCGLCQICPANSDRWGFYFQNSELTRFIVKNQMTVEDFFISHSKMTKAFAKSFASESPDTTVPYCSFYPISYVTAQRYCQ